MAVFAMEVAGCHDDLGFKPGGETRGGLLWSSRRQPFFWVAFSVSDVFLSVL